MKKENLFRIILLLIFLIFVVLTIIRFQPVETQLLQGFIRDNGVKSQQLLKLSNQSSLMVNVIFEGKDYDELSSVKNSFEENFNFENIKFVENDYSQIVDIYRDNPVNFISSKTYNLLLNKKYDVVANNSLNLLYNPMGFYIQTPDKDPYLLVTDFVLDVQNSKLVTRETVEYEGKLYLLQQLELGKDSENEIGDLIQLKNKINNEQSGSVYLTGTPIHSYSTATKSAFEINLICFVSTLALILLCKLYFKSLKILIPIALSIIFGMLFGYLATSSILGRVHILTFVFSTTLIGISLDYSLHYFLARNHTGFLKNLTSSMLTTVLTFLLLLFSGVEILKQIAIYTSFGLLGVYAVVVLVFPLFSGVEVARVQAIKLPDFAKYKKVILSLIIAVIVLGFCKISFNDDVRNLYNPSKELLKAEVLYKKVFNMPEVSFLTISGNDYDDLLQKENLVINHLNTQNLDYYSFSKLFPSIKKQKENVELVKDLYLKNLDSYAKFLTKEQRENLKKSVKNVEYIDFRTKDSNIMNKFFLDEKTAFVVLFDAKDIDLPMVEGINLINVSKDITCELKYFRELCLKILPIMFVVLLGVLVAISKIKKACKIILSPVLGTCFAIGILSIFNVPLNLFNILAMFLIVGFSVDYSIFRASGDKNSKDAVLISFISTALSFLLLSFTCFKLISSLGLVLFLGISTSYILSLVLISENVETDTM